MRETLYSDKENPGPISSKSLAPGMVPRTRGV